MSGDAAIRSTDQDALLSRWSAVSLGYLDDPFLPHLLTSTQRRTPERRPPLINLGTHARTYVIDQLVLSFLLSNQNAASAPFACQVVSLGAGSDTRFWRARRELASRNVEWSVKWIELDFADLTSKKSRAVSTKAELKALVGQDFRILQGGTGVSSQFYELLPVDLRHLSWDQLNLSPQVPTLLLAECVLVYLEPKVTNDLLSSFTSTFNHAAVVTYDPFGLQDSFGQVMKRNLASRGLELLGAVGQDNLDDVRRRLESVGFDRCQVRTIKDLRDETIPDDEIQRVMALERIDEVEELNLIIQHYAIAIGSRGSVSLSFDRNAT